MLKKGITTSTLSNKEIHSSRNRSFPSRQIRFIPWCQHYSTLGELYDSESAAL